MWKNSFNADGTVFKENGAWITNRGILVLPNYKNKKSQNVFRRVQVNPQ